MSSRKNIWLIIIIVGLTLSVFTSNVLGENLIEYFEDNYGTIFYYNKDSVKQTSGKVKVWVTERWGEKEKSITMERMTQQGISPENFEKVSFSRTLFEMNCREETYHILNEIMARSSTP